ncbi:MAG: hypothetical protein AABZ32_04930 [Bacteroidota bacterium]
MKRVYGIRLKTLLFLIPLSLYTSIPLFAQDTIETYLEQKLENLAESSQNEETDYTNLLEALNYYTKHPINLNHTNTVELAELDLLDELQIECLLRHIEKNGKLISVYELQSIDGFDLQTIEKILPYVKVLDISEDPHVSLKEILQQGDHQFILRGQQVLEDQTGFSPIDSAGICNSPNSRYIGSPQKIYSRYRFNYENNVSVGITAEKDAGELFFKKNNKYDYSYYNSLLNGKQKNGFDFYSAHFFLKNIRFIKALSIGDYQIGFGQGLTTWSGLAYGKTSDAMELKKNGTGVRHYTSVDENLFFRGSAITVGSKSFQATGFFSKKKIDASITLTDSLNTVEEVSSLQTTGLHTTPSEIADRHAITQTISGGNISYRKRKYSIGVTGIHTLFGAELNRSFSTYNQFEFTGKQLTNVGADYSLLIHNFNFFGEVAMSDNGGLVYLNGCIIALDPKLSLSVLHRNFQKNYQSLFANAIAESSTPANEQGTYFGITAKPKNSITINAYYDHFVFPWLKYQVNAPSSGNDFLVQLNYTPNKKFNTYIRYKQKDKFVNDNSSDEIDFITPFQQTNYRWHIAYQISPSLKLHNRVEYIVLDDKSKLEKENGYLIYQDVIYKKMGNKISLTLRYALFDTKSYDTRIYSFETDIPGAYSIPSYYYKGGRAYLMLNYDITRHIELWLRWSQTYYANQNIISAGSLTEIQGHTKSEVKVQLKLKF